jgi:hypothetical protein
MADRSESLADRREFLKKTAQAAGVAFAAPLVLSAIRPQELHARLSGGGSGGNGGGSGGHGGGSGGDGESGGGGEQGGPRLNCEDDGVCLVYPLL